MRLMETMVLEQGKVLPGGVLKVGSFLNQQIDTHLLRECGLEIRRLFAGCGVSKVLTIEASGIAIAAAAALAMDVPMVFAKKHRTSNVDGDVYTTQVHSFTHGTDYTVVVSREYLCPDDTVLLVDDFLANGAALRGLVSLVRQSGAALAGAAVAIEKCFQHGGDALRAEGLRVEALAAIESMDAQSLAFRRLAHAGSGMAES